MKLGACDYVVRRADDAASFECARRLELAGIEFFVGRDFLRQGPDSARVQQIKAAAKATGLAIPSLCLFEHNNGGVASDKPAVVDAAKEDLRQAVAVAEALGASVILVPFFFAGDLPTAAHFDRAAAAFRELCPIAAAKNVCLCYEGTLPAARIREMAQRVGSDAFGCYFDIANVVWRGMDSATEIRALGKLIRQVHIKESRVGPGDVQPGLGRVNFPETAKALREIGYDGWLIMETPGQPTNSRDIAFVRGQFPAVAGARPWPRFGAFCNEVPSGQIDKMLADFHEFGLSAVQLSGPLLDDCLRDPAKAASYARKLESNGTSVVGLFGYRNIAARDPAQRKANLDHLALCLEIAPAFENPAVATETGTLHPTSEWAAAPENWEKPAWDAVYAALDRLLPVAEKNGSVLALECYVNNIVQTEGQVIGLFEKYPSRNLQLVLDPYNYCSSHLLPAMQRVVPALLNRFEHRWAIAHLKDVGKDGAENSTPAFGQGVFPQKLYADFLRTRRPDMPIILEHLAWGEIPKTIALFRKIAGA